MCQKKRLLVSVARRRLAGSREVHGYLEKVRDFKQWQHDYLEGTVEHYKNLNGNSGVSAFEIKDSSITVQFDDGAIYLYDETRPGKPSVDHMKGLAQKGSGLNSYISTVVKKNYAKKIR